MGDWEITGKRWGGLGNFAHGTRIYTVRNRETDETQEVELTSGDEQDELAELGEKIAAGDFR